MTAKEKYNHIANTLPDCKPSKMFGAECIKAENGKALALYWKAHMVFKLKGEAYDDALSLDGASVFEPSEGRPMGGWVQLPYDYQDQWGHFAQEAKTYVSALPRNTKKQK